jgi:hypothetical protein
MAFIIDNFNAHIDFWMQRVDQAMTVNARPDYINLFPAPGDPAWNLRGYDGHDRDLNIDARQPAECRLMSEHLFRDITFEVLKLAALVTAGVALTALVFTAVCFVAVYVILVWAQAVNILFELTALIPNLYVEGALFGVVFLVTELSGIALFMNIGAAWLVAIASIWTKVVIPNVQRGAGYISHLHEISRSLEFAGAE